MSTWYAIQSGNWDANDGGGNSTQWNSAPDGSGAPAAYGSQPSAGDTCDLNGQTVNVDSSVSFGGGTICVVDGSGGGGLLQFNATGYNLADDWECYCNVAANAEEGNIYVGGTLGVNYVNSTCGALSITSLCSLGLYWEGVGGGGGNLILTAPVSIDAGASLLTCDNGGHVGSVTCYSAVYVAIYGTFGLSTGTTSVNLNLQVAPGGEVEMVNYTTVGPIITALPPSLPPVGDVASGVNRGDGVMGTRIDCPATEATTAATYGDPSSPITGSLDMNQYALIVSLVSASQVLVGVPVYPGGPVGTFGGLTAAQITQLLSTVDDAAVMALVRS